ncbi:putative ATP synthase subunit f, mitochondrial [Prorops nasuta]|uniref:putative ATP synthase subunit f, mitochondrial n=1 Tax=Prorops nasuta TaxID=863751 RepID=UPI0034CFB2FA
MAIGDYPIQYDRKVHGPYDPARYYGKPDTPFADVKLGELFSWISRREKSPSSVAGLFSRAYWRWSHKYIQPRNSGMAYVWQLGIGLSALFYCFNYKKLKHHRNYKYH